MRGRNDKPVQQVLRALSGRYPGWGFWKLNHRLRKNGLLINHKRTLRIYRVLALNLPRRLKKRVPARFWTLNVLDDYNRQLLGVAVNFSLPAAHVVQVLTRLVECHGRPAQLRLDNGLEFISAWLSEWCEWQGIALQWIQPGKPT